MVVISDTSPIINLAAINLLGLLPNLFEKVIIPQKVYEEIVINGAGMAGADDTEQADWVEVRQVKDQKHVESLLNKIHPGEAEALVLSLELSADLVIIDDAEARNIAQSMGLDYTGLLGILLVAKQKKLIPEIRQVMNRLISDTSFRISRPLYNQILEMAGEN